MDVGTAPQWAAEGVTPRRLRTMVRDGQLVRTRRGVYATAEAMAAAAQGKAHAHALQVRSALVAIGAAGVVASHESAAMVHGIPLLDDPADGIVSLTGPLVAYPDRRLTGVRLYSAALPAGHVTSTLDVPVTTIARTVIDLARTRPFMEGVMAADNAIHKVMVTKVSKSALSEVIDACTGWPGTERARRVVAFSDGRAGSPLESCARVIFDVFRLPRPELQAEIFGGMRVRPDGMVEIPEFHEYKADFLWRKYKTVAETDGLMKYDSGQKAIDERTRDRLIREAGYKLVHITWRELLKNPQRVIERILEAFEATSPYAV